MLQGRFTIHAATIFLMMLACVAPTCAAQGQGQAAASAADVVIVLPFENRSNRPEYNWVGESFADSLSELLNMPGLSVISSDERELVYQRVRLPLTTLPSRATAIKLAREARATMIIVGSYNVEPPQGNMPASLQGTARVIKVNEGRLMGEALPDGRWATREYDFGGALTTLQTMQGRLAYQVLYQRDKALPFSQNQLVQQATKVPPKAFEAYVKGAQVDERDATRVNFLKNALRFYADANAGATYAQAAFELGRFYFAQNNWPLAGEYFSKLQKKDPHYAEAAFYASLAYWRQNDLERALAAIVPLSADVPLTAIWNNAGALSLQAAREAKRAEERARLLKQGTMFLERASESAPDDPTVRFNYSYALFLNGKYAEAADQLRPVIAADPRDGQAYFLFAKSLERTSNKEAAAAADDQARRYLALYAKWQTDWQKSQTVTLVPLRLRQAFNRSDLFNLTPSVEPTAASGVAGNAQDLLVKAREFYTAGRDDEALAELRRVITVEPMNAEAYLLIGRINGRRGDPEAAISALKTAIFWDAKLIDAHILLGRIFLERGDRAQAISYARNAVQIDANNQEAIALQRQVETGSK
jgi:tetratricopeptide (TPR) repeat protein